MAATMHKLADINEVSVSQVFADILTILIVELLIFYAPPTIEEGHYVF